MSDLFQLPESKSPRLLWMEANNIQVSRPKWDSYSQHWASVGDLDNAELGSYATGNTEDEAICELAKRLGLRLWNEA